MRQGAAEALAGLLEDDKLKLEVRRAPALPFAYDQCEEELWQGVRHHPVLDARELGALSAGARAAGRPFT